MEKLAKTTGPTTDRRRHDGPSRVSRFKTLRKSENLGTEIDSLNFVTKWQDEPSQVWRTVTEPSVEIHSLDLATTCRTDRRRHDGPSQVAQSQSGSDFFTLFKGRFGLFLL